MPRCTLPKFMEHSVSVGLLHLGVDIEAGVSQLRDFFCQQFHTINRVAEDDGLIDIKLGDAEQESKKLKKA
jgi:hypothetical protein